MHPDSSRYTRGRRSEATSQTYQINPPPQNRANQTLQARKHQNPTQTRRRGEEEASVNLRRETPPPQMRQPEDLWLRSCSRLRPACVSASKPVGQQGRHYAGIPPPAQKQTTPRACREATRKAAAQTPADPATATDAGTAPTKDPGRANAQTGAFFSTAVSTSSTNGVGLNQRGGLNQRSRADTRTTKAPARAECSTGAFLSTAVSTPSTGSG